MGNEVKGNGNLPANVTAMATALAQSASTAGASGSGELYLKMTKFGEWVYGPENTELEEDAILAVNPMGFSHGFQAWPDEGGRPTGEVMVPATQPMPSEVDLPEVKGTWSKCVSVQLRQTNGEDSGLQYIWKGNSLGVRKAYAALLQEQVSRIQGGSEDFVPLVKLNADSYTHGTYGKIFTPEVEVVGWANMDGEQVEEPAAAIEKQDEEPAAEEKPARRRRRKAS